MIQPGQILEPTYYVPSVVDGAFGLCADLISKVSR